MRKTPASHHPPKAHFPASLAPPRMKHVTTSNRFHPFPAIIYSPSLQRERGRVRVRVAVGGSQLRGVEKALAPPTVRVGGAAAADWLRNGRQLEEAEFQAASGGHAHGGKIRGRVHEGDPAAGAAGSSAGSVNSCSGWRGTIRPPPCLAFVSLSARRFAPHSSRARCPHSVRLSSSTADQKCCCCCC